MIRDARRFAVLRVLLAAALLPALGCPSPSREPGPETSRPEAPPPPRAGVLRGLLFASGDSLALQPCGGGARLRVLDRTGGELARAHAALGSGPGGPVFVEVFAESAAAPAPWALSVLALVRASPVGERAGCDEPPAPYRFRATGNEPFWSATVTGDSIVFQQPDEPSRIAFRLAATDTRSGPFRFRAGASAPEGHVLTLTIRPGRCTDSMSGALYSWTARAELDGRELAGCAREGDLAPGPRLSAAQSALGFAAR